MSTMPENLKQMVARFDGLTLRERALLLLALLVVVYMGWSQWLWQPLDKRVGQINAEVAESNKQIQLLSLQLQGVVKRNQSDPNIQLQKEIQAAEQYLQQLEERIRKTTDTLIEPKQMAKLLEALLINNGSLRLVQMETLETKPLVETKKESDGNNPEPENSVVPANIYRHGFAIEFEGGYLQTLKYLKALEELPWQFFWDGVELRVIDYPTSRVRLELHTLSLSRGWIGV